MSLKALESLYHGLKEDSVAHNIGTQTNSVMGLACGGKSKGNMTPMGLMNASTLIIIFLIIEIINHLTHIYNILDLNSKQ